MAGEMLSVSLLVSVLLVGMSGSEGAYQIASSLENAFHDGLKIVQPNPVVSSERFQASQEVYYQHQQHQQHQQPQEYHLVPQTQQQPHHQPESAETHVVFQPQQQFVVQSAYNVGAHPGHATAQREEPTQQQHPLKQRQTALPCNNQRLHVKIEYPGAGHGIAHPTATVQHAQEPKQDYRASIPKSIAPKLNPLHHSFHQNRNFVPLHHITRQVPVPAGRHGHIHSQHSVQQHPVQPHSAQQHSVQQHAVPQHAVQQHAVQQHAVQQHSAQPQQPVKAALVGPPPKHIAG